MIGKSCKLCGGILDRNGVYCQECKKALPKGYDVEAVNRLSSMPIIAYQKRTCASCKILSICVWTEMMLEGCSEPITNIRADKMRMKALGVV